MQIMSFCAALFSTLRQAFRQSLHILSISEHGQAVNRRLGLLLNQLLTLIHAVQTDKGILGPIYTHSLP